MVPWSRGVCKWGMQSEWKATHEFSWFSCNICTHWFSLTCLHWSIALFRLSLFMSRKGQCYSSPYSSEDGGRGRGGNTVQTLSSSASLQLFMSPKHWEAVICIYIRSLDQARGLLALGVLCARVPSPLTLDMHPQATYVLPVLIHGVCQLQNCHAVSLFLTLLF